ncbi:MAG: hypothetical protein B7X32_18500 [Microbacterium sp. 13-71-7]|nr:MAG: hypothetical protein B7X32_18500 [Microbacterium sp. 13-71-7]
MAGRTWTGDTGCTRPESRWCSHRSWRRRTTWRPRRPRGACVAPSSRGPRGGPSSPSTDPPRSARHRPRAGRGGGSWTARPPGTDGRSSRRVRAGRTAA